MLPSNVFLHVFEPNWSLPIPGEVKGTFFLVSCVRSRDSRRSLMSREKNYFSNIHGPTVVNLYESVITYLFRWASLFLNANL